MKIHYITLILVCIMGLVTQSCGKEPKAVTSSTKPKHELYLEWHNHCIDGKTKEIDQHIKKFEAQLKTDENDQLARAYLGSANALRAKASFWGPSKLKYLNRGKTLMDKAVTAAPEDPRVRMVRAIGFYKVPKRFGKRDTSIADFEKLLPIATSQTSDLKTNERQAILYYAWLAFDEEGHAKAALAKKTCHQLAPQSKYGKLTAE